MKPRILALLAAVLILAPSSASSAGGPDDFPVTQSIADGSTLSGKVTWTAAAVTDRAIARVEFRVNNKAVWSDPTAPYQYGGDPNGVADTTRLPDGQYVFSIRAVTSQGSDSRTSATATIKNTVSSPLPSPSPTPSPTPSPSPSPTPSPTPSPSPPAISSFSPTSGPNATSVAIMGNNLGGTTAVRFNGVATASYVVKSSTTITAIVPAGASTGPISITTSAGTAVSPSAFTVTTAAPPSSEGWRDFVGVAAYRSTDMSRIAGLGISRVRWDRPSASTIASARSLGIEILPIAAYNPWSDLNGGRGDKYPPLPQHYGEWARRMVDTWRGMSEPPTVVEVWNEPWLAAFWQPKPDPAAYLALVKAFAAEAWKVWPNLTILVSQDTVGDTNTTGSNLWRKNLLAADTTGFLKDPRVLPTTHNYVEGRTPTQVTSEPCKWDLDRFKCAYNDLKAHGHPDPKVWVTEFGWESGVVGETKQADYVEAALKVFRDSGKVARAYGWMLKTNDSWSYNWLRPDNTDKPVTARVRSLVTG